MTLRFETPREIPDIAECAFYYLVDLPGVGQVGYWDLRRTIDQYFGGFDFTGKRARSQIRQHAEECSTFIARTFGSASR
jgi:hypothetical protein